MKPSIKTKLAATLLAIAAALAGCKDSLDEKSVHAFVDAADEAARKRYAPEICKLRAEGFTQELRYHAMHSREPAESTVGRKLWCREAARISMLYQYQLERTSLEIDVAADHQTAKVIAGYKQTMPYYGDGIGATPDNFQDFIVIESRDESVVGFEDGDLVFLNARVEARETELIPKTQLNLPYH